MAAEAQWDQRGLQGPSKARGRLGADQVVLGMLREAVGGGGVPAGLPAASPALFLPHYPTPSRIFPPLLVYFLLTVFLSAFPQTKRAGSFLHFYLCPKNDVWQITGPQTFLFIECMDKFWQGPAFPNDLRFPEAYLSLLTTFPNGMRTGALFQHNAC